MRREWEEGRAGESGERNAGEWEKDMPRPPSLLLFYFPSVFPAPPTFFLASRSVRSRCEKYLSSREQPRGVPAMGKSPAIA